MKIFLDTNVLVAASVRQHPHFQRADLILRRCAEGEDEAVVHAHSLLEFHSASTQLPRGLAVPPSAVEAILNEGILPFVHCVSLTAKEIQQVQKRAGQLAIVGGMIYDLFHLAVAEKEQVERIYTFNTAHFQQIASPDIIARIVSP
jgi:predicted nucleic acid-binding protein